MKYIKLAVLVPLLILLIIVIIITIILFIKCHMDITSEVLGHGG